MYTVLPPIAGLLNYFDSCVIKALTISNDYIIQIWSKVLYQPPVFGIFVSYFIFLECLYLEPLQTERLGEILWYFMTKL